MTGASGSGKTVAINALLARNLARGATGYIIDRSSSVDEGGHARHQGHYEQLAALIPGARVIHFGAGAHDAILNPWDVADTAAVPASKVEFLVALHTLLIGDTTTGEHATLGGLERTLLARGIQAVYAHCAETGELPRERLLYEQLRRLAREQATDNADGDASVASELRRLAERLHPYVDDGPAAWLADRETTIPRGAPLLLCDLAGLPDALAGPVMLTLVDHIDRDVARRRAHHLAHPHADGGAVGGPQLRRDRRGLEAAHDPSRGRVAERMGPPHPPHRLRAAGDHAAPRGLRERPRHRAAAQLACCGCSSAPRTRSSPTSATRSACTRRTSRRSSGSRPARASTPPASSTPRRTAARRSASTSPTSSTGPAPPIRTATNRCANSPSQKPTATRGARCGCSSTRRGTANAPKNSRPRRTITTTTSTRRARPRRSGS